jgi:hypothetical protein
LEEGEACDRGDVALSGEDDDRDVVEETDISVKASPVGMAESFPGRLEATNTPISHRPAITVGVAVRPLRRACSEPSQCPATAGKGSSVGPRPNAWGRRYRRT